MPPWLILGASEKYLVFIFFVGRVLFVRPPVGGLARTHAPPQEHGTL